MPEPLTIRDRETGRGRGLIRRLREELAQRQRNRNARPGDRAGRGARQRG
jgi:hypothetical protein